MKAINLIAIFILLVVSSCSDINNHEDEYGYVVFYTDIQYLTNCGEFNVNVYVNGEKKGVLPRPFLPMDSVPDCNTTDSLSTLKIQLKTGTYSYYGDADCGTGISWDGDFKIQKNNCTFIYLSVRSSKE